LQSPFSVCKPEQEQCIRLQLEDRNGNFALQSVKAALWTCFASSLKLSHIDATIFEISPNVAFGFSALMAACVSLEKHDVVMHGTSVSSETLKTRSTPDCSSDPFKLRLLSKVWSNYTWIWLLS